MDIDVRRRPVIRGRIAAGGTRKDIWTAALTVLVGAYMVEGRRSAHRSQAVSLAERMVDTCSRSGTTANELARAEMRVQADPVLLLQVREALGRRPVALELHGWGWAGRVGCGQPGTRAEEWD